MRIATFNLESLGGKNGNDDALQEKLPLLRPQLERLKADVLCLQEINGQKVDGKKGRDITVLRRLLEGTRYEGFNCITSRNRNGDGVRDVHNLVILSGGTILRHEQVWNSLVVPPSYRLATEYPRSGKQTELGWDRPILICEIELCSGVVLHVINVHLRAPLASAVAGQKASAFSWKRSDAWAEGFFLSSIKRTGQALEVRLCIDRIFDENADAMIAVCGDFNAEQNEAAMRIVEASEDDTANGALAHRMLVPVERSIARDRRYSVLHHGRPQMLDHILVSRRLLGRLQDVEIHNEMLQDESIGYAKILRSPSSYHAPLVAEFND